MLLPFAREGAHVAVADIHRASADDTVSRIAAEGGRAFSIAADIAREADVNRMVDEAIDGLAGLDGLVLNVGIGVGALGLDGVDLKGVERHLRGQFDRSDALLPQGTQGHR